MIAHDRFATAPITIAPGRTTATATLLVESGYGREDAEGIGVYATANVPDADHKHGGWALTSPTVTMTIYDQGQSPTVSGSGRAPPEQEAGAQPSAVTLSLDRTKVSESAGTVTVTAALDAPAPEGGIGGFLFAGADGTASEDIDFIMPPDIFIPGGQRSATAAISITSDDVDEADETVVISALFDLGTAVLEDTVTLTITDDDTAPDRQGSGNDDQETPPEETPPEDPPTQQATSNGAPTVAAPLADISLRGPTPREISLSGVFSDPDGDSLIITAVSSHHHIASMWVSLDDSTLTVVGISTGTATITVTARDPAGNQVSTQFEVTVSPNS